MNIFLWLSLLSPKIITINCIHMFTYDLNCLFPWLVYFHIIQIVLYNMHYILYSILYKLLLIYYIIYIYIIQYILYKYKYIVYYINLPQFTQLFGHLVCAQFLAFTSIAVWNILEHEFWQTVCTQLFQVCIQGWN